MISGLIGLAIAPPGAIMTERDGNHPDGACRDAAVMEPPDPGAAPYGPTNVSVMLLDGSGPVLGLDGNRRTPQPADGRGAALVLLTLTSISSQSADLNDEDDP